MNDSVYSLENVSFTYNGAIALDSITFSVKRGESLAVLGANGSGKSTLLKIMNALAFPAAGVITFEGENISSPAIEPGLERRLRQKVAFVFNEPDAQLFCPSVLEELCFGPMQLGLGPEEARRRATDLLEMLGMSRLGNRPPHALSSGEKKKVAIAAALSTNPAVILLDEPTSGLDPRSQVWLIELLVELKKRGKTLVLATHDLSLAEDLAERAVVLNEAHAMEAEAGIQEVLGRQDLLLKANIIHVHAHRHGDVVHVHGHGPYSAHDEHD